MLLEKNQKILQYTVVFPLMERHCAELYSVRDGNGRIRLLQLSSLDVMPASSFDERGESNEAVIFRQLRHPGVIRYIDSTEITLHGKRYVCIVTEYSSAESVGDKIRREGRISVYETKNVVRNLLKTLQYLHTRRDPVLHNAITSDSVWLDLTGHDGKCILTDFSHSRFLSQDMGDSGLELLPPAYVAPERWAGVKTIRSDIYSAGILMYQMLFGYLPDIGVTGRPDNGGRDAARWRTTTKAMLFPDEDLFELDEDLLKIIAKATRPDFNDRFASAEEMLSAFDRPAIVRGEQVERGRSVPKQGAPARKGNGFDDVAGMQDIKQMLMNSVINVLRNREMAGEYGISIPNGILFYGPPGCGKSFFAEKFAEETGFHYRYVKSSDLASVYIHGTQEKIGQLFREAREQSPTVLCFDEFDALVPKRDIAQNLHQAGEVNEFLSQLNSCGKDGVFVIATTNQPDMIDTAVLRKGRIDHVVYLPPPDHDTRQAVFQLHLKNRPCESAIDYGTLADLTENYVASDIAYIVNAAAIRAFETMGKISQKMLETLISESKPSFSPSVLKYYEDMRRTFEKGGASDGKIGFHL